MEPDTKPAHRTSGTEDETRGVSVIMPVLNEERHLADAVRRVLDQEYPGPVEIVLALGPSKDRTAEVAADLAAGDDRVRAVPNPTGKTPVGLNAAIRASRYPIVVRVDGHALIPPDYLATAARVLRRSGADNVGGVMAAEGVTSFQQAVARAMTTRLGVGAASFHVGGAEGPALTVYLGAFRREALEAVGGYDESMERAQDWELNHRIRADGGQIWFTPEMRVVYRPRSSVGALARQYFGYGRWRRAIARRYPETVSLRYLAAPITVVGVAAGTAAAVASTLGPKWLALGALAPVGYLVLIGVGSVANSRGLPAAAAIRLPAVYATMHGAWGAGYLSSPSRLGKR